jgi:hypothetical protein
MIDRSDCNHEPIVLGLSAVCAICGAILIVEHRDPPAPDSDEGVDNRLTNGNSVPRRWAPRNLP